MKWYFKNMKINIQVMYLADKNPKPGFPYNEVCNFNQDTCGFKNGGSSVWNWRTVNSTGMQVSI